MDLPWVSCPERRLGTHSPTLITCVQYCTIPIPHFEPSSWLLVCSAVGALLLTLIWSQWDITVEPKVSESGEEDACERWWTCLMGRWARGMARCGAASFVM